MQRQLQLCFWPEGRVPILLALLSVLTAAPTRADACQRSELLGRVQSVILSEAIVDSATGNVAGVRQVLRIDVSKDGTVAETTLALSARSAGPPATSTTYFQGGRPVRAIQTAKGKTVPSMKCSYDSQGRLLESDTGSEFSEFRFIESYEYGPGFIRRRTTAFPGVPSVTTQTLDATGRVIKEVVVDESTSTVHRTSEVTYDGNQKEVCEVSSIDSRRRCATTIHDSHGNDIEVVSVGRTLNLSFEYDSVGNWISKRTSITGSLGISVVTIEERKIEYW
jgi:hypothetical protein